MKVKSIGNGYLGKRKGSLGRGFQQSKDTDFPQVFDKIIEGRSHEGKNNGKTFRYE